MNFRGIWPDCQIVCRWHWTCRLIFRREPSNFTRSVYSTCFSYLSRRVIQKAQCFGCQIPLWFLSVFSISRIEIYKENKIAQNRIGFSSCLMLEVGMRCRNQHHPKSSCFFYLFLLMLFCLKGVLMSQVHFSENQKDCTQCFCCWVWIQMPLLKTFRSGPFGQAEPNPYSPSRIHQWNLGIWFSQGQLMENSPCGRWSWSTIHCRYFSLQRPWSWWDTDAFYPHFSGRIVKFLVIFYWCISNA